MFHQKASSCLQTGGLDHTLMPDEKVTHIARVNYSDTGHIHHSQPLAQVINIDGAVVSSVEAILVSGQYNKWPSPALALSRTVRATSKYNALNAGSSVS